MGILRKIPEEGLSAAARETLFPKLKVRRARGPREQERKLRLRAQRQKVWARVRHPRSPPGRCPPGRFDPRKRRAAGLFSSSPNSSAKFGPADPRPDNLRGRRPGEPLRLDLRKGGSRGHLELSTFRCSGEGYAPSALFEKDPHPHWGKRGRLEAKGQRLEPTRAFWRAEILGLDEPGPAPASLLRGDLWLRRCPKPQRFLLRATLRGRKDLSLGTGQ